MEIERALPDELDPLPFVVDEDYSICSFSNDPPIPRDADHQPPLDRCLVQWRENDNRRLASRSSLNAPALPRFEGALRDMNMSGVALKTSKPVLPGTVLELQILTAHAGLVVETGATVVRCEPAKSQGFQIICRLHRYLTFAEIREIGRALFASAIV